MGAVPTTSNKYQVVRGQVQPESTIIAVGGGKGGIGKSFVSSSLAIFLANLGHETYLIDLDFGSANLHTTIGEPGGKIGLNDFLTNSKMNLQDAAVKTNYSNLKFISGNSDHLDIADLNEFQRSRLMSSIYKLRAKYIVLDLSAGVNNTTLDFFLAANHKVVVFTPEPSSIENAYRFLKSAFYRKIRRYEDQLHLGELVTELMTNRDQLNLRSPSDLLKTIAMRDQVNGSHLYKLMGDMNCEVILNQVRSLKDADLGTSIQGVCTKYFGVPFGYLGHIEYDNAVWQALRKKKHLLTEYPHSRVYAQLMSIARRLNSANQKKSVVA